MTAMDEVPPDTISVGGHIYFILGCSIEDIARLTRDLRLANASYAYWVIRRDLSPDPEKHLSAA